MAPYGGLFFHKSLLDNIGFPNVKFNTYGDDYEFTLRMIKNNYKIYLCKNYFVEDIDKTFGHNDYFNKNTNEKKIYFQIRNHTSISKKFITNILFYRANMFIFIFYILMRNVFKIVRPLVFFRRVNIILKAIIDGNKNF